jgi:hypothetical protein
MRHRVLEVGERREIEVGLVDAGFLEGVGALGEKPHDPRRHLPVQGMRATEKHRGRFASTARRLGKTPRPGYRHGRPDAVRPGRVTGGGDDTASPALLRVGADDDRLPAERGVTPLLHRGVERVHVEMGDDPHRIRFL